MSEVVEKGKQFDLTGKERSDAAVLQVLKEIGGSKDDAKVTVPVSVLAELVRKADEPGKNEAVLRATDVPTIKKNGEGKDEDPLGKVENFIKKTIVAAVLGFAAAVYGYQIGAAALMLGGLGVAAIAIWVGMIAMQAAYDAYH